jgi:hypothetical protein
MMHGREKSDSAIVAGKPTNKAVPTAAEPVEPRAGAKGNASQQSTHRTQGRERVSQALERVRQAAQRKKEKFTALLHHISIDSLRMAFFAVKRDAASGVDGLTWPTYEADLERNLTDLHERVHRGAYRALPSRRVYIPKPDGRQRPLAVAALEDHEMIDNRGIQPGFCEPDSRALVLQLKPVKGKEFVEILYNRDQFFWFCDEISRVSSSFDNCPQDGIPVGIARVFK